MELQKSCYLHGMFLMYFLFVLWVHWVTYLLDVTAYRVLLINI